MLRVPTLGFNYFVSFGEEYRILTDQMMSIQVDWVGKVINLSLRDTIDNETARALFGWTRDPIALDWCICSSASQPLRSHLFTGLLVVEHQTAQDYAKGDPVQHDVRVSFRECETLYA